MMTCKIHQIEYEGRCQQCRSVAARVGYYVRMNRPVPNDIGAYWKPGAPCSVCGEPVLTEADKHPRTQSHRKCGDPHSDVWRKGDPCTKCGLPVEIATKHKRFKAHAKCIEKQVAETKRKTAIARKAYHKQRYVPTKPKPMPPKFVGAEVRQEPIQAIVCNVPVRRLPSLMHATLRNPETGILWELEG